MSGTGHVDGGGAPAGAGGGGARGRGEDLYARVEVSFELRGSTRPQVAASASELVDRLQELASRAGCDCDLDVSIDWQQGGEARPTAEPRQPARTASRGR